jgi:hypothetical protein
MKTIHGALDNGIIGDSDHAALRMAVDRPEGVKLLEKYIVKPGEFIQNPLSGTIKVFGIVTEVARYGRPPFVGRLIPLHEQHFEFAFIKAKYDAVHRIIRMQFWQLGGSHEEKPDQGGLFLQK